MNRARRYNRDDAHLPPPLTEEEFEAAQAAAERDYGTAASEAADQRQREDERGPDPLPDLAMPW